MVRILSSGLLSLTALGVAGLTGAHPVEVETSGVAESPVQVLTITETMATPVTVGAVQTVTITQPAVVAATEAVAEEGEQTLLGTPTVSLRQATRQEIIDRINHPDRRAAPSEAPAPESVKAGFDEEYFPWGPYTYHRFYSGSGYTMNDINPGSTENDYVFQISINKDFSQEQAIDRCASQAVLLPDVYFSFQVYYDASPEVDKWMCFAYTQSNSGSASYFNVPNPNAKPVYGYSL
ncbi:hypothetical protein IAU60_002684 [Kwoniella sp. DSM 27419]